MIIVSEPEYVNCTQFRLKVFIQTPQKSELFLNCQSLQVESKFGHFWALLVIIESSFQSLPLSLPPQQNDVSTLKQHLCSAQVFSYPQLHKEFVLQTDDSDCGLGAVLAQKDSQGNEHVVAYAGRTLRDREKRHCHGERSFSNCFCHPKFSSLPSRQTFSIYV